MKRAKKILFIPAAMLIAGTSFAQVGINSGIGAAGNLTANVGNIQRTVNSTAAQTARTTRQAARAVQATAVRAQQQTHVIGAQVNGHASTTALAATDAAQAGLQSSSDVSAAVKNDMAGTVGKETKAARKAARQERKMAKRAKRQARHAGQQPVNVNSGTDIRANMRGSASGHHAAAGSSAYAANHASAQAGKMRVNSAASAGNTNDVRASSGTTGSH